MPPDRPSLLAWSVAVTYAVGAYAVHRKGVMLGLYPRFFWFQLVTHFLSASAMAVVLVALGRTIRLPSGRLVAFVLACSAFGAVGWELVEYLGIFPRLHWWGVDDSSMDLVVDGVGVGAVLVVERIRRGRFGPTREPTPVGEASTSD